MDGNKHQSPNGKRVNGDGVLLLLRDYTRKRFYKWFTNLFIY